MRVLVPVLFGVIGVAVLVSLGMWQLQRLVWKEAMLAEITGQIGAAPVDLPLAPDPAGDRYLPVRIAGQTTGEELHVLASLKDVGAVYRVIAGYTTDAGRGVMVDLGTIPTVAKDVARPAMPVSVTGNLHWPDETDSFTPAPDTGRNIWFARDVTAMAAALGAEPVMVVARSLEPGIDGVTPLPVGVTGIPNDHLQYVITWFSLAAIWAGMTAFYLWRMWRPQREG